MLLFAFIVFVALYAVRLRLSKIIRGHRKTLVNVSYVERNPGVRFRFERMSRNVLLINLVLGVLVYFPFRHEDLTFLMVVMMFVTPIPALVIALSIYAYGELVHPTGGAYLLKLRDEQYQPVPPPDADPELASQLPTATSLGVLDPMGFFSVGKRAPLPGPVEPEPTGKDWMTCVMEVLRGAFVSGH